MSTEVEKIVRSRMHMEKRLRLSPQFETAHSKCAYSGRLMFKRGPIVRVLRRIMKCFGGQFPMRHFVASQFIRHDLARLVPVALEQAPEEALGGLALSARLYQHTNEFAVLSDRAPRIRLYFEF